MRRSLLGIAALSVLLLGLDLLYRVLHPEVNLVRASLVGLSALAALAALERLGSLAIRPWIGALAIFASAFLSVLLIQAGCLVSRSPASGLVHLLILAATFPLLDRIGSGSAPNPSCPQRAHGRALARTVEEVVLEDHRAGPLEVRSLAD